jgi:Spy/CpxP family protein refolding chaperone
MTRVTKYLTALALAVAAVGVGAAPALADNHAFVISPSQPVHG